MMRRIMGWIAQALVAALFVMLAQAVWTYASPAAGLYTFIERQALKPSQLNGNFGILKDAANAITSDQIVNGTIQAEDVANGTLPGAKLQSATVAAINMAPNAIDSHNVIDASLGVADLNPSENWATLFHAGDFDGSLIATGTLAGTAIKPAPNGVSASQVNDGAITASKLSTNATVNTAGTLIDETLLGIATTNETLVLEATPTTRGSVLLLSGVLSGHITFTGIRTTSITLRLRTGGTAGQPDGSLLRTVTLLPTSATPSSIIAMPWTADTGLIYQGTGLSVGANRVKLTVQVNDVASTTIGRTYAALTFVEPS